jgi:hypothetical protein
MAGSISLSLSQQFDSTGAPLNGGLLHLFAAGTTSPQSAYQDSSLTIPWPNPIVLDSAGRVPPFYLADGQIKIRLTNAAGVTQVAADNLLVVGASSGSGSAPSVDPTTIMQVGFIALYYGTGARTGFVRLNGRTIGSATSGASERANADCQALFEYLWGADANLTVSTGRGASANADWVANKTIALPDWRGYGLGALDDMGNSPAGRLTATYFGTSAIVLGAAGGAESKTLVTANLPPYTPSGSIANGAISISHNAAAANNSTTGGGGFACGGGNASISASQGASTFTGTAQGGTSTAFSIASPLKLATFYIKI